jgi:hypothetical protein
MAMQSLMRTKWILLTLILGLCAGIGIGWYIRNTSVRALPSLVGEVRQNSPDYKFINPLLFVRTTRADSSQYKNLEAKLNSYVEKAIADKNASSVSIYYRNLSTSEWAGVNESALYVPSSMMKVGVMMGILKNMLMIQVVLSKKMYYEAKVDPRTALSTKKSFKIGLLYNSTTHGGDDC